MAIMLPSMVVAQVCPAVEDRSADSENLLREIRLAPDELSARLLTDDLWQIWASAPDAKAQEMLDRGMRRREAYDYDAAILAFDELVAYCPDYAEGYNQRAFINYLRQDYTVALGDLEHALQLAPRHVAALSGQALTLMNLGRVEAGQSVLRDALKLHPWLPERRMLIEPPGEEL